ncbi:MAG: Xaa-Pro peptidase family protein [Oscillospiraceae bacterium]|nr:Xaa-Pro peptidase family protein [Oscillospiraceae bacterium]
MNHLARIRAQLERRGMDAVLITDGKNQRYAAGFPFTDGVVLAAREGAWLITDSRYIEAAQAAADEGVTVWLFDRAHPLSARLKEAIRESGAQRLAAEDRSLSRAAWLGWEKKLGLTLEAAGGLFADLRAVKDEAEIEAMTGAQRIAEAALEELLHLIRPGMTEREAAAELVYQMLRRGSEGNSFDPIVVTGSKTSMPHGVPGDRVIRSGDFVTMDFGCIKNGYCSDMTRTVAIGSATDEMKNVYDTVLRAQLAGIRAARAGVLGRDVDAAARKVIADAGFGEYFGHGFGHCLGLDIHEPPYAGPTGEAPLPAGCVSSAEPGIYLPGRFGVRIEDVMVIREDGAELITRAPKEFLII